MNFSRGHGRYPGRRSLSSRCLTEPGARIAVTFGVWMRNIPPARMILFCEDMEV